MKLSARLLQHKKAVASTLTLALVIGVPVTFAVLHPGFPVSDLNLTARDVWTTNSQDLLAGRLNKQINALSGSVRAASASFDVFQNGDNVFLEDERNSTLERIDPAFTTLSDPIKLPAGAVLSYGGDNISIISPDDGALWIVNASNRLEFDPSKSEPIKKLGSGSQAVVTQKGDVLAATRSGKLYRFPTDGGSPRVSDIPKLTEFQLTAVGDTAVVLDTANNSVIKEDGSKIELAEKGERIQQVGPRSSNVLIASPGALLEVPLNGGSVKVLKTDADPASKGGYATAPVFVNGCAHAAWADSQKYLFACDGKEAKIQDIPQSTKGGRLEFRVNRSVVVLNNLGNGNSWVLDKNLTLVNNWDEVAPANPDENSEGEEEATKQSFADTLTQRTEQNHPPLAVDDTFGVRPGTTTILPVLDNDSDVDGDVLTIGDVSEIPSSIGSIEFIDSGRALQFTPADGAVGGATVRYTATDGRPGGIAQATLNISIRQASQNAPPVASRSGAVIVEAGQSVTYNVLKDWIDPDGDDLQVVDAVASSGDTVRYTPDGFITFQHSTSEIGIKDVNYTVSDGKLTSQGTLAVDVKPAGSLDPIGVPDFATGFVGAQIAISPLSNDRSPSGEPLKLISVKSLEGNGQFTPNLDSGVINFTSNAVGSYYLEYTVGAATKSTVGVIRVDVVQDPSKPLPPVAVKDVVYLRDSQSTIVPVLDNDLSPSGRILAIQTVEVPPEARQLAVEILSNTVLRITSSTPLTSQLKLTYTISDGVSTSSAGVTIVPVAPLVKHQAPIAVDDLVTVRAGDIATVDVLKNDFHPDGISMFLAKELPDPGTSGLAFVTGNTVRFQAPKEAGQYSVTYKVMDQFNESAIGRVTFTVTPKDDKNNRPPIPSPVKARVFAGANTTIEIPLQGIDPDGDSVTLVSIPGSPLYGEVVGQSSNSIVYQAGETSTGTDSFTYQVMDSHGATAVGSIDIAVIPRAGNSLPPVAVNDAVSMRPGRTSSVDVLSNDSDPNGYSISVDDTALVVPKGITARVENNRIVVQAPDSEGAFAINYTLTNGHGGTATATINVSVSKDALPQYPTATDHILQTKQIVGKDSVSVNVLDGAQNPGGLVSDLKISLIGSNTDSATVKANGVVEVTPGIERQAIAYRLTDTVDNLSAEAFIIVPARPGDGYADPPILKPGLPKQITNLNQIISWQLKDIVLVPSGRPALLTGKDKVVATHSNGDPVYTDGTTLTFTPEKDYRGPATIQFEVTDGSTPSDPEGNKATLTLVVTVGDPNFEDVAPTFTALDLKVEAGGSTTVDLRDSTAHPNPAVIQAIQYGGLSAQNGTVSAQLSGSTLSLTAPLNAAVGTVAKYTFTLTFKSFTVKGSVTATVVSSLKPLAQAVTDGLHAVRNVVTVVSPLTNDVNPFPATPLKIIAASLENPASGAALSFTSSTITVTPGPSFIGDVSIIYTVQDATSDSTRNVTGRVIVTVWDVPDRMTAPAIQGWGDSTVTVRFSPPPSINGSAVINYTVRSEPASTAPSCAAGSACVFTGLTNGVSYRFYVTATNEVGTSQESPPSAAATPYRTPSNPTSANLSASGYAPATMYMSWGSPSDTGGGNLTYNWQFTKMSSASGTTASTSANSGNAAAGTYAFHVQACNPAGCSGWTQSGDVVVVDQPNPRVWLSNPNVGARTIVVNYQGLAGFTPTEFHCWGATNTGDADPHHGGFSPANTFGEYLGIGSGSWPGGSSGSFTVYCPGGIQNLQPGRNYFSVDMVTGQWSEGLKVK